MKKLMKAIAALMLITVIIGATGCDKEITHPELYLIVERATLQEKFLSFLNDKAKIEGEISNMATKTKYKDIELAVHYYSKTNTEIRTDNFVLYEYVSPNGSLPFKLEVTLPDDYSSFNVEVVDATAVKR